MVETNPAQDSQEGSDKPQNRVINVVRIQEGDSSAQKKPSTSVKLSIAEKVSYQALILLQDYNEIEMVADSKIPLSCLPINQLPLVAYQISFLESNGIYEIFVCVHQSQWKKVDKTLKLMMEKKMLQQSTTLVLVVLEEETETASALKLIQRYQNQQEDQEQRVLKLSQDQQKEFRNKNKVHQLKFEGKDIIVLNGCSLLDTPLADVLAEHYLRGASITSLVEENDLNIKTPGPKEFDIYGIADLEKQTYRHSEEAHDQVKRLIVKSSSNTIKFGCDINVRKSILHRVKNLTIRTDLSDLGCIIMKRWLIQLLLDEEDKEEKPYNIGSLFDEFVPYIAKHQFKSQLRKYDQKAQQEENYQQKMDRIMNPMQTVIKKDFVHVNVHIVPKQRSGDQKPFFFTKLSNDATYEYAQEKLTKDKAFKGLNSKVNLFPQEVLQEFFPTAFGRERIDSQVNEEVSPEVSAL